MRAALLFDMILNMKRRVQLIITLVLLCMLVLPIACGPSDPPAPSLTLTVFACGKADAILLQFDDYAVMIDTGEHGDGEELAEAITNLGVGKIDLMILTHHDKDHIGGADTILSQIPVEKVRMPAYESDSKQYQQLTEAIENSDTKVIRMSDDAVFPLGSADFVIWTSPIAYDGSDNEQSLVTKVVYRGKTFLFTGDAEKEWLKQLCLSGRNLTCDVLKLPHHGQYDKNLPTLLALTLPEYILITDSVKNPADPKTIDLTGTLCQNVLRTENGTIRMTLTEGILRAVQY